MKTNFILSLIVSLVMFASSCGRGNKPSHSEESAEVKIKIDTAKLAMLIDPVCKMSLEQFPVGDTTTYEGKLYGFCSTDCKKEFLQDPQAYLK